MYIVKCIIAAAVFLLPCSYGQSDMQSSLTFVIDDTASMSHAIVGVKVQIKQIFEAVANSKESPIEEFILVTFGDPDLSHLTTTKEHEVFRQKLDSISVHGGGDCPELSMAGIELALSVSKPGSYLYVFTDADSKDSGKYDSVANQAREKGCMITFVLTSNCGFHYDPVYSKLAEETKGEVFLAEKTEVSTILNYFKESSKTRRTIITEQTFPPGENKLNYTVDGNMKELIVSVKGKNPSVELIDEYGVKAATEEIVKTARTAIVKLLEVKPGVYTAQIKSDDTSKVTVSGTNTIHFEHGFSRLPPKAIEETTVQPFPGEQSFLSVKVRVEGGSIELQSIQIQDLDHKVILEEVLDLINDKDQFYSTREPFVPPSTSFRIAIIGYDVATKSIITRIGLVPIEQQDIKKVVITNKAPSVKVIGDTLVNVEYQQGVELKCRISAYPKPDVVWTDDAGNAISSEETQIELPYDYVSVINVESVDKNITYRCRAKNEYGEDYKTIEVWTKITRYFNVIEKPTDMAVELEKEVRFTCRVDAAPMPASIKWFREDSRIRPGLNYDVSFDGSVMTIKAMKPYLDGNFKCTARNNFNKKIFRFNVVTTGIEKPEIEKEETEVRVRVGSNAKITCRVLKGTPTPSMQWFFKPAYNDNIKTFKAGETYSIKKVDVKHAGTYRCEAFNAAGEDYHYKELIVEYAPVIVQSSKRWIRAVDGETVRLPCLVQGEPTPDVTWFINGTEITDTKKFRVHRAKRLIFKASVDLSGTFSCEAVNHLGKVTSNPVSVLIIVPVTIETPSNSTHNVPVGSDVSLDCIADGYPKPTIKWAFNDINLYKLSKNVETVAPNGTLSLPRIQVHQEGYYTCVARNLGSTSNITHTVKVLAAPKIMNLQKHYSAVQGDWALRVPCKTSGSPKPKIRWNKDGYPIASGTEWNDIEDDGTLVIKYVDKKSQGDYICVAENDMGSDVKAFKVAVEESPEVGTPTTTVVIAEGKSSRLPCDVPHEKTDLLRWFKNGTHIVSGELTIRNAKLSDAGVYSCRVSTMARSITGNAEVVVGHQPRFNTNPETHKQYEDGGLATLDCTNTAVPKVETTWWYNSKQIMEPSSVYRFEMNLLNRGIYYCLVKNQFGYVVRQFEILTKECALDLEKDFGKTNPMLLSEDLQWPNFEVGRGYVHIPHNQTVVLSCDYEFEKVPSNQVEATCVNGSTFVIDDKKHEYSDLQCKFEFEPVVLQTGESCFISDQNELLVIGYENGDDFLDVYEICFDNFKKLPLYAKVNMRKSLANTEVKEKQWFGSDLVHYNFDEMYDCENQIDWISAELHRSFHDTDNCCFSKRQLISDRDVIPGLPQISTFSHLNVIPHWSTCNAQNWEMLERRLRKYVKAVNYTVPVWTGIVDNLDLEGSRRRIKVTIADGSKQKLHVPKYIWKVIQDPKKKASLAVIQVNVPDLKKSEAYKYIRCRDICSEVPWMQSNSWRNVARGFTFCCSIRDFVAGFGYRDVFQKGFEDILK